MNVTAVRESDWNKDDGTTVHVIEVTFDDGSKAPGYDLPEVPEIGKPLPEGWLIMQSKAGKPYIKVPKRGGGGGGGATAFRNTKEGQAFEQQQMNRRTALMQAVELYDAPAPSIIDLAEAFYAWLQSSPAPLAGTKTATAAAPARAAGSNGEERLSDSSRPAQPRSAVAGDPTSGEVGTDTTPSVGRVTPPASPDAQREGVGPGVETIAYGEGEIGSSSNPTPHDHDLHPLRAGSKILRCSVAGCGYTERRDG